MQEKLSEIKNATLPAIDGAKTLAELDAIRVGVIGKSGSLTGLMKELGLCPLKKRKLLAPQ